MGQLVRQQNGQHMRGGGGGSHEQRKHCERNRESMRIERGRGESTDGRRRRGKGGSDEEGGHGLGFAQENLRTRHNTSVRKRLRHCADLKNGSKSPRLRAAQREAAAHSIIPIVT